jgi:hypothetical protein
MSFRAALWSTPYGWVKQGLGVSPNSGPPVGGIALMSPQGFFGDPTSALLPATARSGANGNWFFGRNPNLDLIDHEYSKGNKNTSPPSNVLRKQRQRLAAQLLAQQKQRRRSSFGGTNSDSLSGMVKPGPPNMRTFPMLGAYPGEVGPGNTPGGTAYNGSFVGPENPLMSYYFTYGRRRSARRKAHRSVRRSSRRKARRSVRRSMRRC